jgi:hypothetical protein
MTILRQALTVSAFFFAAFGANNKHNSVLASDTEMKAEIVYNQDIKTTGPEFLFNNYTSFVVENNKIEYLGDNESTTVGSFRVSTFKLERIKADSKFLIYNVSYTVNYETGLGVISFTHTTDNAPATIEYIVDANSKTPFGDFKAALGNIVTFKFSPAAEKLMLEEDLIKRPTKAVTFSRLDKLPWQYNPYAKRYSANIGQTNSRWQYNTNSQRYSADITKAYGNEMSVISESDDKDFSVYGAPQSLPVTSVEHLIQFENLLDKNKPVRMYNVSFATSGLAVPESDELTLNDYLRITAPEPKPGFDLKAMFKECSGAWIESVE